MDKGATAARALSLLDLTNLNDDCSENDIDDLCARAVTAVGNVAAVCVWPRFVGQCRDRLSGTDINVAAVANFPEGALDTAKAVSETEAIVSDGGSEVDVVLPYGAWLVGEREAARGLVSACKAACGTKAHLKVILETGKLIDPSSIAEASQDAIEAGADFIKTSTGKVDISATPEAAESMLGIIKKMGKPVGFKASGGIRTTEDAALYLALADRIMGPDWTSPKTFRFGASGLLDDLLINLPDAET
ncbi:MAG: deoxyribose-phosphate aldolase [Rhodospirillales bacterium]|nr:deoxyribose-phosphate aldolase [Rhodospirillales bacterium]